MFGKKSASYTPGARIAKVTGKGVHGFPIKSVKSVLKDSVEDIAKRNEILDSIKQHVNQTGGKSEPRHLLWEILQYEPDNFKRDLKTGIRSHTHVDEKNDIKVKVNIDSLSGDFSSVVIKTGGKRYFIDTQNSKLKVSDIIPKTQVSLAGKSEGATGTIIQSKTSGDKTEDVTQKIQQTSTGESSGAVGGAVPKQKLGVTLQPKKIPEYTLEQGTSNVDNKNFIEKVYSSGGRDVKLLEKTLKLYLDGDSPEHAIYNITYEKDSVQIKINVTGEIESVKAIKGGKVVDQDYIKSSGKSFEEIQRNTESIIKKVYESNGLDEKVLEEAIRNYEGKIQVTSKEDIFNFKSGENVLNIHVDSDKKLSHMGLNYNGEFLQRSYPIDEGEFLTKSKTFYKLGSFTVPGSDLFLQKDVFEGFDSRGNKRYFIENNEGEIDIVVETKEGFFSKVMSSEQQKLFESIQSTNMLIVKNKDGVNKRVLVETVDVNGVDTTVAYQQEDGLWRRVEKNQDGTLYLGSVIKYEKLSSNVQGKLRATLKAYDQYGKLLTGIKDIVK